MKVGHPVLEGGNGSPAGGRELDKEILSLQLNIGTKVYYFDLKSNPSGLYVKIVEKRGDRRSNIIVPSDKLEEFAAKIREMADQVAALPADGQPPRPRDEG